MVGGFQVQQFTIGDHRDDLANGNTGALDTNADGDAMKYTATNVKGRIQIASMWYDALNRLTYTVRYGTYAGSDFDRNLKEIQAVIDRVEAAL